MLRKLAEAMLRAAQAIDPYPDQMSNVSPATERAANRAYWIIVLKRSPETFDELPVEHQYLTHDLFRIMYPN